MNTKIKEIAILVLVIGAFVGGMAFLLIRNSVPTGPSQLDGFAQCLKDKGANFYGAFWCPHCQAQKKLFGSSVHLLPYVECSTPDGSAQNQICKDKKIEGYPTWEFSDGTRLNGEIPLATLAEKTGCVLPAEASKPADQAEPVTPVETKK